MLGAEGVDAFANTPVNERNSRDPKGATLADTLQSDGIGEHSELSCRIPRLRQI